MNKKKIIIVGAGPGGLTAAMILAKQGHEVVIYEKQNYIGGRTSPHKIGDFTFELGPTFVMLPKIFEEVFALAGKKFSDYVQMKRLDILYGLHFDDGRYFPVYFNKKKLKKEIARLFPGDELGYDRYMAEQKIKFEKMYPCLQVPYSNLKSYLSPKLLSAIPYMQLFGSLYDVLTKYFKYHEMRIAMTFQAKYLGMSPWTCPGPFSILSYIEHAFGVYHPIGGVHKLTEAMAKVALENGAQIKLQQGVGQLLVEDGRAAGVKLESGKIVRADQVIMNADFGTAMTKLVPESARPSWTDKKLLKRPFSCSTFMIYLGLKKKYNFDHHNIFFAADYKKNIEQIFKEGTLPEDPSFYVQNAAVTDDSLAPNGKSTIYILVPVPNLEAGIDWDKEKMRYRDLVLDKIAAKTPMKDIREQIEVEEIITPRQWRDDKYVYKGAVFNLAHTLGQMLYLRPHNQFEDIPGLYIVGGGTHPGSGLPTIVESGRIVAAMIK